MLQLVNRTCFKAKIVPMADADGVDAVFAIVRGTFDLAERPGLAAEQTPVQLADVHHGEPDSSSLRTPSDVSQLKPGADVILGGTAWAPAGRATAESAVTLRVGTREKTVRVVGRRTWQARFLGLSVSKPEPFESMPLRWELAFGGQDRSEREESGEERNPVGLGFCVKKPQKELDGVELPRLEDPARPIRTPQDRPQPAGFGAICAHWLPRREYAGTYDETWERERAPYLPDDFDPRFFQCAPAGQVLPEHPAAPIAGELVGLSPDGPIRFEIPHVPIEISFRRDRGDERVSARLDTVLIDADAASLTLVWRAKHSCDKEILRLREVQIEASDRRFAPSRAS